MMFNGAGLMASLADDHLNGWNGINGYNWVSDNDRHQFIKAIDAPALQPVLVQMVQEWVKTLVLGQDDAQGVRLSLKGSSELEGDVKVQGILASAFYFLKINTAEPVSCFLLA